MVAAHVADARVNRSGVFRIRFLSHDPQAFLGRHQRPTNPDYTGWPSLSKKKEQPTEKAGKQALECWVTAPRAALLSYGRAV